MFFSQKWRETFNDFEKCNDPDFLSPTGNCFVILLCKIIKIILLGIQNPLHSKKQEDL